MMRRRRQPVSTKAVSITDSIPAPVGGLNARDAIANMPKTDALIMDNFFPGTSNVALRKGYENWATGITGKVETLAAFSGGLTRKLFAVAVGSIYDATAKAAIGAALVTGLTNARWQHANFGTPGGQFLVMVNGADLMQLYNGTGWQSVGDGTGAAIATLSGNGTIVTVSTAPTAHKLATGTSVTVAGAATGGYNVTANITVTSPTSYTYLNATMGSGAGASYTYSPAVTGVLTSKFAHVNVFKNRLWFVERDSFRAWYLPIQSIGGAATVFDFSSLFKLGGYLQATATLTIDNAFGVQEYFVVISSEGEIVIYQGSDPASSTTWALVGHFRIGAPVGRRCFVKVASDLLIICADGFFPLSKALLTDRLEGELAISNKIVNAANNDVQAYGANFGWQPIVYPIGNKILVNVPQVEGRTQYQYVMNTITKAWCRFTGWNANCFEVMSDQLYFGGDGVVAHADYGHSDNGANIVGDVWPAQSYFRKPGMNKQFTMARPIFAVDSNFGLVMDMCVDFENRIPTSSPGFSTAGPVPGIWNVALWNVSYWQSGFEIKKDWQTVAGVGFSGSLRLKVSSKASQVQLQSIDYMFQPGGPL